RALRRGRDGTLAMSDSLMTPGLRKRLEQVEKRYDELGTLLSSPEVTSDPNRIRQFGQELSSLTAVVDVVRAVRAAETRATEALELTESDDGELADLAREELASASLEVDALTVKLRSLLVSLSPMHA